LKSTLISLALAAAFVLTTAAPSSAVPATELAPARLERGADVKGPHLEGRTVVDGDVRVPIRAGRVRLLGPSGDDYVVGTAGADGIGRFRVLRVTAGGAKTVLLRGVEMWEMVLSGDGTAVADETYRRGDRSTRLRVWSTTDGHREISRRFPGSVSILDFDESRMVLGSWAPDRTFWWNVARDRTRGIVNRTGYRADIGAARFASFTGDPYEGGCSVVAHLAEPRTLWKSCSQRVEAFAPTGGRAAAVHILSDGVGPNEVRTIGSRGKVLARYTTEGWFGGLTWETSRALLLETVGSEKAATVRCELRSCQRASALRKAPSYRVSVPARPVTRP
jgi:hypothetical protein